MNLFPLGIFEFISQYTRDGDERRKLLGLSLLLVQNQPQGLDHSFYLLAGQNNYFKARGNVEDGEPVPQTEDFYSTTVIADHYMEGWDVIQRRRYERMRTLGDIRHALPPMEREVGSPGHGLSLVPVFARDGAVRHEYLWWQHEGNRALRAGDWKIVASGEMTPWELYDLSTDRGEQHDLAQQQRGRVREMAALWAERTEAFRKLAREEPP